LPIMFSGGIAGITAWLAIYPLDLIKSKIQTNLTTQYLPGHRGILQCSKQVLKDAGFKGLFKGLMPALIRSFPVNCASILSYELTLDFFKSRQFS